jgi:hypothetical protein
MINIEDSFEFFLGLMYRLNQTESAFSCNFVVINASEGSLCFKLLTHFLSRNVVVAIVKNKINLHGQRCPNIWQKLSNQISNQD